MTELHFNNPPIIRRCYGVYIAPNDIEFARGIEKWNKLAPERFPESKQNTRWNITFVPRVHQNPPRMEQVPKAIISHDYYESSPEDCAFSMSVKRNSLFFHWRRITGQSPRGDFDELRNKIDENIKLVAGALSVENVLGIETHYHNRITYAQYPEFYTSENSLKLGEIIRHFASYNFEHEGYGPPNCSVQIHFAENIGGNFSISKANIPDDQGLGINVDFRVQYGIKDQCPVSDVIAKMEESREYIHKMFRDMFTDAAHRSFK